MHCCIRQAGYKQGRHDTSRAAYWDAILVQPICTLPLLGTGWWRSCTRSIRLCPPACVQVVRHNSHALCPWRACA